jgi:hypothetical protein
MEKEDVEFMKSVYRNWGYYSKTAHKQAEEIKQRLNLRGLKDD